MASRVALALITSIGMTLLVPAPTAHACSSYPRCGVVTDVLPRDGATAVPTNVLIRVSTTGGDYFPLAASRGPLVLREVDGEVVDTELDVSGVWPLAVRALRASAQLRPETAYEVVEMPGDGCSIRQTVITTFTTGTVPDEIAPTAPVVPEARCGRESCGDSSCCGPYDGIVFFVSRTAGVDDATGAADMRDQLLVGGDVAIASFADVRFLSGVPPNGRGGIALPGGGDLAMRAVDLAGNLSEPVPVVLSCPPLPDAGSPPPMDGSLGAVPASAGGCACSTSGAPTSSTAALTSLLAFVWWRRRRAARDE